MSEGTIAMAAAASYPWKTLLGVGISALAVGGGAGVYSQDGDVASLFGSEDPAIEEELAEPGLALHDVGRLEVNLKDAHAGRVLEMHVQIEVPSQEQPAAERVTPALRDAVLLAVSDYTYDDLEGVDGKARLKDELLSRFHALTEHVTIERLYLTQFVVR